MLRVTGIIAFVATSLLAVLLFARIQSVTLAGTVDDCVNGNLYVRVKNQAVPQDFWRTTNSSFKVLLNFDNIGFDTDGSTEVMFGAAPGLGEIPKGAAVKVTHRWVWIRRPDWAFGCTEIRYGDRRYSYGLSPATFFEVLGLISAAPVVLWTLAALAGSLFRRRSPRPEGMG